MLIRRWCLAHNVALFMLKVIAADSGNSGLVTGEGVCGESSPCAKRQPGRNRYWQWRTTHAQVDKCGACERRERDPGGSRARVQLAGTTDRAVENGHCCSARRQQCIAPHCRQALSLSLPFSFAHFSLFLVLFSWRRRRTTPRLVLAFASAV